GYVTGRAETDKGNRPIVSDRRWGREIRHKMPRLWKSDRFRRELRHIALTLLMVAVTAGVIELVFHAIGYRRGTVIFLIPVVIAASAWSLSSALVAAVAGMFAAAFFFYPPFYSLRIRDPQEVINLVLYIFVAVVV